MFLLLQILQSTDVNLVRIQHTTIHRHNGNITI